MQENSANWLLTFWNRWLLRIAVVLLTLLVLGMFMYSPFSHHKTAHAASTSIALTVSSTDAQAHSIQVNYVNADGSSGGSCFFNTQVVKGTTYVGVTIKPYSYSSTNCLANTALASYSAKINSGYTNCFMFLITGGGSYNTPTGCATKS